MITKVKKPWNGSDHERWKNRIKPRWGFLSVNGKGYLYHHFKTLKYSKSLGPLLGYESEKDLRRRVKKSDDDIGRLVGGRGSPDRTVGSGIKEYRDSLSIRYKNSWITRTTYDTYRKWIDLHERGLFKDHLDTPLVRFDPDRNHQKVREFFWTYFKSRTKKKNKKGLPLSNRTLVKEIGRLQRFFKFLVDEGMMSRNPMDSIGDWLESQIKKFTPRQDRTVPKSQMVEKYQRWKRIRGYLLKEWNRTKLVNSTSERIFLIQSLTGMRVSEVSRMQWDQVEEPLDSTRDVRTVVLKDFTELQITSKGKTRTREIPEKVQEILREIHTEQTNDFHSLPRWVVPSPYHHGGDPDLTQPMVITALSNGFKRLQAKIGESQPLLTTHELRNFFITDLIERGVPEREVSTYVRHSSVKMTRYYLRDDVLTTDNVLSTVEDSIKELEEE